MGNVHNKFKLSLVAVWSVANHKKAIISPARPMERKRTVSTILKILFSFLTPSDSAMTIINKDQNRIFGVI
jgi:hypothetical protein